MPCVPATMLKNHDASVNSIAWAPHSAGHICSGADDKKALIWDIQHIPQVIAIFFITSWVSINSKPCFSA